MYQLIEVRYRNGKEGKVDDVTLNELVRLNRIESFYRPAEDRWVDIGVDAIRKNETPYRGAERRVSHREEERPEQEKPRGLLVRLLRRRKALAPPKEFTAEEWFQQGFLIRYRGADHLGAVGAFAKAIQLDPTHQRAYLNRGMVYEWLGNGQQALEDYTRAIELSPDNAKVYFVRGLLLRHLGQEVEAIVDLRRAADLRYRPAVDVLKQLGITHE